MWKELPSKEKEEYKKMILAFASLTEMFAQKSETVLIPIINSKYQETVFQKVFHAHGEDIGNTSYDASLVWNGVKYLIGIKTFSKSSKQQKIAQFKANHDTWANIISQIKENAYENRKLLSRKEILRKNYSLYLSLAKDVARIRNMRIKSSEANLRGFEVSVQNDDIERVYHVLMPGIEENMPIICVGETDYTPIDIDNIKIIGCRKAEHPTNFVFEDGNHKYRFTSADSQLYMNFDNDNIIEEVWDVHYADNAYEIFSQIGEEISPVKESYIWPIKVEPYSGWNGFYGLGSKLGIKERKKRIKTLNEKYKDQINPQQLKTILNSLEQFYFSKIDKKEKEELRKRIIETVKNTNNSSLLEDIYKAVFRAKNEMYIPIPNAYEFHKNHPDFFGENVTLFQEDSRKLSKNRSTFSLIFEPSGNEIECFITQDDGKGIESVKKQSILGQWILREVFQLEDYEPLTEKRLEELGIRQIKLEKYNDRKVHLSFV